MISAFSFKLLHFFVYYYKNHAHLMFPFINRLLNIILHDIFQLHIYFNELHSSINPYNINIVAYLYHIFIIHSAVLGHLALFQFLAIVFCAAMKNGPFELKIFCPWDTNGWIKWKLESEFTKHIQYCSSQDCTKKPAAVHKRYFSP